jgi:YidC/Oxa1 family membrane protein insertase
MLNEVKLFFSSLNILIDLKNIKPKIVFFSEHKSYQKYSKLIIDSLCSKYTDQIYYFSIDKDDKINDKRVNNYFVNPLFINFFFKNIKAENMFLTLTDLGNNLTDKTKNIDKYIYYFHSPVSTTKNYTQKAFDNYDIIMCNGQFQVDEIKSRENLKKLTKKKLIPSGYFYFDYLIKNINYDVNCDEILIAPSWNKDLRNFINENFIELINVLIKKKYKVIFRPHPEHFKRSKNILNNIKKKFSEENFKFDEDTNNIKSMEKAKCLITDSSGIAIEYIIALKRPVLYLDEHDKIHNSEFKDYSNLKTIDQKIKENFGYSFKTKDFNRIDEIIKNSEEKLIKNLPELDFFINNNYFNYGNTENFLHSNIKKII